MGDKKKSKSKEGISQGAREAVSSRELMWKQFLSTGSLPHQGGGVLVRAGKQKRGIHTEPVQVGTRNERLRGWE